MKKPLMIPVIMIVVVGVAVFLLPALLGQQGNAELAERTSTVGGGLIGLGLVAALIVALKK
jgi:hypothetical protein